MKALLIDTPNQVVREIEIGKDYKEISRAINCDVFTCVILDYEDAVYVDDEGLINGNPHGWFKLSNYDQPLRGYGLVLGTDDAGNSTPPMHTLDQLASMVTFPDPDTKFDIDLTPKIYGF